jgi:hypothetical protein
MRLGPDGALYVIEWGTGFYGANADARIVRLEYVGPPPTPDLRLESTTALGLAFLPEPEATHDEGSRTFTLPLPPTTRFFRIAAPAAVRITDLGVDTNALVVRYE